MDGNGDVLAMPGCGRRSQGEESQELKHGEGEVPMTVLQDSRQSYNITVEH